MAALAVVSVVRERFSAAPRSLRSILEHVPEPFDLVVTDPGYPQATRARLQQLLAGRDHTWLEVPGTTSANVQRNRAIEQLPADAEWVAVVENDVELTPGWIQRMQAAMVEHDAEVGRPLILGRRPLGGWSAHFDGRLERLAPMAPGGTPSFDGPPPPEPDDRPRITQALEWHAVMFRRSALERLVPFDEVVSTRLEVDLMLRCLTRQARIVFVPDAPIRYLDIPRVARADRPYFRRRWDPAAEAVTDQTFRETWGVDDYPVSREFSEQRRMMATYSGFARLMWRRGRLRPGHVARAALRR